MTGGGGVDEGEPQIQNGKIIYADLFAYHVNAWRPLLPLQHGMVVPRLCCALP